LIIFDVEDSPYTLEELADIINMVLQALAQDVKLFKNTAPDAPLDAPLDAPSGCASRK
jgi:hypothetical protein